MRDIDRVSDERAEEIFAELLRVDEEVRSRLEKQIARMEPDVFFEMLDFIFFKHEDSRILAMCSMAHMTILPLLIKWVRARRAAIKAASKENN